MTLQKPEAFGDRYLVDGELGRGGMAIVYRAIDRKHNRPVALKVMRPEIAATVSRERFLREISIAARLQHPHILPLIDSGDANGTLYYVAQYLEGETLAERIARDGRLPVVEALRIAVEVVSALRYAHEHGVLHRDVKPANIMLTGGHAVVMDFGIAMAMGNAESRLTSTGMIVGTPAYMSPENLSGDFDARSDIYAVGCVLYEMLAGSPPFVGPTAQAILLKHATSPVPVLSSVRRDVPRHVELIVMRALAKQPAERFGEMSALHAELQLSAGDAISSRLDADRAESEPPKAANLEAYDSYLRGIYSFDKRTRAGNRRAIELLEKAVRLDPTFAPALAALASAYIEEFFTYDADEEWEEKAFSAIERARAIDPGLARIHVAKGNLLWTRARRFPHAEALAEFRRALEIDPDMVEALNETGRVYWHIGKLDEAVTAFERALAIDSAFIDGRFRLGFIEICRGNFNRSLELLKMVPVGSLVPSVDALIAMDLHYLGCTDEGRDVLRRVEPRYREDPDLMSIEAIFLALEGKPGDAETKIENALSLGTDLGHFHHTVYNVAAARALMGDADRAIDCLRRCADDGFPCHTWFERDPCLASLREDPRFQSLVSELKRKWA